MKSLVVEWPLSVVLGSVTSIKTGSTVTLGLSNTTTAMELF